MNILMLGNGKMKKKIITFNWLYINYSEWKYFPRINSKKKIKI